MVLSLHSLPAAIFMVQAFIISHQKKKTEINFQNSLTWYIDILHVFSPRRHLNKLQKQEMCIGFKISLLKIYSSQSMSHFSMCSSIYWPSYPFFIVYLCSCQGRGLGNLQKVPDSCDGGGFPESMWVRLAKMSNNVEIEPEETTSSIQAQSPVKKRMGPSIHLKLFIPELYLSKINTGIKWSRG